MLGGLGVPPVEATPPAINSITLSASGQIVVAFEGTLQSAPTHTGAWTDVPGATGSPYSEPLDGPARFFRALDAGGASSPTTVGYYNVTLVACASLIANQLDNGNGNKIVDLLPAAWLPNNTVVKKWNLASSAFDLLTVVSGNWNNPASPLTLAPGEGAFIVLPSGSPTVTVTFLGTVRGSSVPPAGDCHLFVSDQLPDSGANIDTILGGPATEPAVAWRWDQINQTYVGYTLIEGTWYDSNFNPSEPLARCRL